MHNALAYSLVEKNIVGSITAKQADPNDFDPQKFRYYCPDCFIEHAHFTRLTRVKGRESLPPRFVLYDRHDSTHACDLPARFHEIDSLADPNRYSESYDAVAFGDHAYSFPLNMADIRVEPAIRGVFSAERLKKILYATMFDPDLLKRQRLHVDGKDIRIKNFLYDTSKRAALIRRALEASKKRKPFYAAVVFNPLARRDFWRDFTDVNGIPGQPSRRMEIEGEALRPNVVLRFQSRSVGSHVRTMVSRNGGNKSAAVLAFGRVCITPNLLRERIENLKAGKQEQRLVQVGVQIDSLDQVTEWNHPKTFKEIASMQGATPEIVGRPYLGPVEAQLSMQV
ncbi:MAG: hypothetical protein HRT94_04725 [Alphaproteobacteria bacterium]|nr:hypothetical protein [Alphaproteobacteria bacterium]